MSIPALLFSFEGRIGFRPYIVALGGLVALQIGSVLALEYTPFGGIRGARAGLLGTIICLSLQIPIAAVIVKRLHDRDWPAWPGYVMAFQCVLFIDARYFGSYVNLAKLSASESLFLSIYALTALAWIAPTFVNASTPGPNR